MSSKIPAVIRASTAAGRKKHSALIIHTDVSDLFVGIPAETVAQLCELEVHVFFFGVPDRSQEANSGTVVETARHRVPEA